MRSLLDTEEEESEAREITLSTASLLGIFFGLVLICGVFFGFGYSMGRGAGQGAQAASLGTGPAHADDTATAEEPPQPAAVASQEPEAQEAQPQEDVTSPAKAPKKAIDDAALKNAPAAPPKHVSQVLAAATESAADQKPSARVAVATPSAPSASVTAPGSGKPMVQIAAVARQEDADVLVSALRQRGYGVVVRSEPQDKLLHIQVGPFADRVQATAIKQKLLSDGYNAIIKQ